jgi:predicted TIM-barrel fold metal-dependent hydrolase
LDRFDYSWLTDAHPALRRNYTANDIEDEMKETPIKYGVFVKVMCKKPVSFIL